MAIQLRVASSANVTNAATSLAATLPVGWQPGDIAFIMIRIGSSVTQSWSQSGGTGTWTQKYAAADATGGYGYAVYWRVLQTGDTNPTFSWATTSTSCTWVQVSFFSDVGGTLSIDAWATELDTSVAATTVTPNSVTAAGSGECSLLLTSARANAASSPASGTFTPPTNWTRPASGDVFRLAATPGWSGCCYQLGQSGTVAPGVLTLTDSTSDSFFFSSVHVLISESIAAPPIMAAQPGRTWLRQFHHKQALPLQVPPVILTNNFEGVTPSGTTLTQGSGGNTGGVSGNFFDSVSIGASATLASDSTHAVHGNLGGLSCQVATAATSTTSYVAWITSLGTVTQTWFRAYLYFTANPSANTQIIRFQQVGTLCASLRIGTTGTLAFLDSASATIFTTTAAITLNQWVRVEGFVTGSATTGQVELKLFNTADSLTADETDTSAATQNTFGFITAIRYGITSSVASVGPFWIDDIGLSTAGYLGPTAADPLQFAAGAGGDIWRRANAAATNYDRREVPQQRAYVSDPNLLSTALLENELLGGADTARHQHAAAYVSRLPWMPQQPNRQGFSYGPTLTVTATQGSNAGNGMGLQVFVLTGAASVQSGATWIQSAAGAHNATASTTQTGSRVYGAVLNGAAAAPTPFDANTTLANSLADAGHTKDYGTWKATSATGTPGSITFGFTDNNNGGVAGYEVLPAGTITEDGSAPPFVSTTAATSLTSASFSPPPGALLVAVVATNGQTSSVVTMALSDSTGLAWTPMAEAHASNMKYAGVWIAQVKPVSGLLDQALLENELLGGADTVRHQSAANITDRREVPQQRNYVSDPLLLTTALLENELLGGADTARYYLAAAYWDRREVPQQRIYIDPNEFPVGGVATDPTLSAWLPLWLAYNTQATNAARWWMPQQPARLADPLLIQTAELENELLGGEETGKYYRTPATHALRWWMPEQRAYVSDPLLLTTALLENELLGGGDTARHQSAANITDRREVPQQRVYYDISLLTTALLENELLGGAETGKYYRQAAYYTRWWMPQQLPLRGDLSLLTTALLENELLGGGDTARHQSAANISDRREVPQQRAYVSDPLLLTTALLENELLGGGDTLRHLGAAYITDRREVPQQRAYVSDPLLLTTALLEGALLGSGDTARHYMWFTDRRLVPQQRAYISNPSLLTTALLENELLGGADTLRHYLVACYWDRRLVPQQRPYVSDPNLLLTALLENELLGGAGTSGRYNTPATNYARWWMPQQPARLADPLLIQTALLENELLGGGDTARYYLTACYWDRREVPQQRLYISDPSFYPTTVPVDPLTIAWGAGGTYWHMYNQAADVVDRREVPQQRAYVSDPLLLTTALLENELLGGADTLRHYLAAAYWPRWWMPQQEPLRGDLSLLTTALLENELLGGADTLRHYLAACYWDRRLVPQQRLYISDPSFYPTTAPVDPITLAYGAGGLYWQLYNFAASYTDRREVPQQRIYYDTSLLTTALLENELLGGADTLRHYLVACYWDRRLVPQQRAYVSDPNLLTTALLEGALLGSGDTARHYMWFTDRREVPQQRLYISDPNLLLTALLENELLGGADTLRHYLVACYWDRRLVPQQRAYVSDPLLLLSAELEGAILFAYGADGNYWHLYNRAADITDRREVPQQRNYISNPSLLATAELENELLGGGDTQKRYFMPATHTDRREVPQQRNFYAEPGKPLDPTLVAWNDLARRYLTAATHTDRREYPQQQHFLVLLGFPPAPTILPAQVIITPVNQNAVTAAITQVINASVSMAPVQTTTVTIGPVSVFSVSINPAGANAVTVTGTQEGNVPLTEVNQPPGPVLLQNDVARTVSAN